MIYGYARVSTEKQDGGLDVQISALKRAGVEEVNIFCDRMTGTRADRPEYQQLKEKLTAGDKVIIHKLDRLGRSQHVIVTELHDLEQMGIAVQFLEPAMDTADTMGKAMLGMLTVFAELERNMISDRTKAGLQEMLRRGVTKEGKPIDRLGRRPTINKDDLIEALKTSDSKAEAARKLGVTSQAVSKAMARFGIEYGRNVTF